MKVRKFKTEILVRDNMIAMMEENGINVHYKLLNDKEYIQALRNKVQEEAQELAEEQDRKALIEEIADLMEVLNCLKTALDIEDADVILAQQNKVNKIGSFANKQYTEFLEISEDNPAIEYYLNKSNKYPEILE